MNLVDPLEPDGARMERAFTEFPQEMGELKASFPELSAMDLARFLSATEYDLPLVSGELEHLLLAFYHVRKGHVKAEFHLAIRKLIYTGVLV